jgi:hypothetical protein
MGHFYLFSWEILDHSTGEATETVDLAEAGLAVVEASVVEMIEDLVEEEVSVEAEADSAAEEIEEKCQCAMQFVQSAVKIVKFHLNQQVINQFIAVIVSETKEEKQDQAE